MGFDYDALAEAASGAVGGLLSTTILYPLDTCKTKYQAEVHSGDVRKYKSLLDVLWEAVETRNVLSLYQGVSSKNLQSVISQLIYFYSYKSFKNTVLQRTKAKHLQTGTNLLVAAAAGAVTAILTQPLDTASARIQTSTFGKSKGLWATLTEGNPQELFAGLGASLLLTSNPAIQYTVFEQLKDRILLSKKELDLASASPLVLSAFSAFVLGALSKTVATVVTYPAIRCKVMIQAAAESGGVDVDRKYEKKAPKTMNEALQIIWQQEGPRGFYKGLNAQIFKTVLGAALMLMIKEKTSQSTWAVMLALQQWSLQWQKKVGGRQTTTSLVKTLS